MPGQARKWSTSAVTTHTLTLGGMIMGGIRVGVSVAVGSTVAAGQMVGWVVGVAVGCTGLDVSMLATVQASVKNIVINMGEYFFIISAMAYRHQ